MTTRHMTQLRLLGSAMFLLCLRGNAAPAPPAPQPATQHDGSPAYPVAAAGGESWEVNWIIDLSR